MIPISDDNPPRHRPLVSWSLVAACVAVFLWQIGLSEREHDETVLAMAFTPERLFSGDLSLSVLSTLITSMFLHAGLMHLGSNMLYLWVFGNNVEDAMGHTRFLIFYLASGVAAALGQGFFDQASEIPMVGASGAISGVLGAYVLIFPGARVTVIVPLGILLYPLKISALFVVGFWFVVQLVQASLTDPGEPGVAWWAHIGGFAAGILLTPFFSRFPLFGRWRRGPWG
jgi:membrane associated rhomboid family serine protease